MRRGDSSPTNTIIGIAGGGPAATITVVPELSAILLGASVRSPYCAGAAEPPMESGVSDRLFLSISGQPFSFALQLNPTLPGH